MDEEEKAASERESKNENEELININRGLMMKIEQIESEKVQQIEYLAKVTKLMSDLKEAYALSTTRMQERIFDLMKEIEVREMVAELNTACPARKRPTNFTNTTARIDNHGGTWP